MASFASKKIAVVGGGGVGSTLANALSKKSDSIVVAARNPEKTLAELAEKNLQHLKVQDKDTAIAEADVLILATPGSFDDAGIQELARSLGDVSGKSIIDATNPVTPYPGLEIRWGQEKSGGEVLQEALPDAKVYKAFNTLGVDNMVDGSGKHMLYAGPDKDIADIIEAVGYEAYYVGPIRYARNLEAIAELWIHCSFFRGWGRDFTFAVAGNPNDK